jgi:hypothetical protein
MNLAAATQDQNTQEGKERSFKEDCSDLSHKLALFCPSKSNEAREFTEFL